jgi:hypothetical protein
MTAPARFTQSDVARAVSGARKGGLAIGSVTIDPNGNITIAAESAGGAALTANPWDAVLKPKATHN